MYWTETNSAPLGSIAYMFYLPSLVYHAHVGGGAVIEEARLFGGVHLLHLQAGKHNSKEGKEHRELHICRCTRVKTGYKGRI